MLSAGAAPTDRPKQERKSKHMLIVRLAATVVALGTASPALAQEAARRIRPPRAVPEIDAGSGLLAIAAVATVLLFVWERNRRAKRKD